MDQPRAGSDMSGSSQGAAVGDRALPLVESDVSGSDGAGHVPDLAPPREGEEDEAEGTPTRRRRSGR